MARLGAVRFQAIGGLSLWANIFTGIFAAVILVFFAPFIEILPLTALAGTLCVWCMMKTSGQCF